MRLGQFARKHDLPVQEIIDFLQESTGEEFHPNAKVYDAIESKIYDHFDLIPASEGIIEPEAPQEEETINDMAPEPVAEETIQKPTPALTPEEEILALDGELEQKPMAPEVVEEAEPENVEAELEPEPEVSIEPSEDEVIQSDRLLEMLESEEVPADLEKIKLIKAPKRELAGLKVVGKVDLPEPKPKSKPEPKEHKSKNQRPQLSEEEREKRRLRAKKKQEEYEARKEKRRKEKEQRELRQKKEAHYRQKLEQAKSNPAKPKKKKQHVPMEKIEDAPQSITETTKPKTALGKFWRWLNT